MQIQAAHMLKTLNTITIKTTLEKRLVLFWVDKHTLKCLCMDLSLHNIMRQLSGIYLLCVWKFSVNYLLSRKAWRQFHQGYFCWLALSLFQNKYIPYLQGILHHGNIWNRLFAQLFYLVVSAYSYYTSTPNSLCWE